MSIYTYYYQCFRTGSAGGAASDLPSASSAIAPSGLRTATDQADGPRIMTPSRTAWPPIGWLIVS